MSITKYCLALLAASSLVSCGSADPKLLVKAGYDELNAGHSDTALEKFDEALKSLQRGDAQYLEARMGVIEALIAGDAQKAGDEFLALSKEFPDRVGEQQFLYVSSKMGGARKFDDAIKLLNAGMQRGDKESPALLAMLERITRQSQIAESVKTGIELNPYVK